MELTVYDIGAFVGFILFVVAFAMYVSRKEKTSDEYFLAGRRLTWWLIGISLIASNISTEHFVGMAGRGYELGLAIAGYEWTAAVAMVLVAVFLLPKFLRIGITTIPEYLEHRYSASARGLMAFYMMVAYVFVAIAAVLYAGSLSLKAIFGDTIERALVDYGLATEVQIAGWGPDWLIVAGAWAIGIIAGIYTVWGGLKAVVWADLFNGLGLILGGVLVAILGFFALGQLAADQEAAQRTRVATLTATADVGAEDEAAAPADSGSPAEPDPGAKADPNTTPDTESESKADPAEGAEGAAGAAEADSEADSAAPEGAAEPDAQEDAADTAEEAPGDAEPAEEAVDEEPVRPVEQVKLAWHEKFALGVKTFFANAGEKLSTIKPFDHGEIPWVAVFIGGLWIPQLFYWGLNQFITQRALGARSVAQGQKGILFAACLKLLIPFIIVFPGIMAFELYGEQISKADAAYPHMIREILPIGIRGLMLAALFGAIMSSLDSMLNSASTIFTMDLFKRYVRKDASNRSLIFLGRLMTALFVILGCWWAPYVPQLGGDSVFIYIQRFWGFLSPGIVTVFLFGVLSKRTPGVAAVGAMLLGIPVYGWMLWMMPEVAFLHHMALTFIVLAAYVMLATILAPLRDVVASSPEAEAAAPSDGFVTRFLLPYGTALLGGLLLAVPVFTLTHVVGWKYEPELWVYFAITGAVLVVYVAVTLLVMKSPTPSVRKVVAPAARRSFIRRTVRGMFWTVLALAVSAVLALHVYLFGTWTTGALRLAKQTTPALQPCLDYLEPYLTKSFEFELPALVMEREAAKSLAAPVEPTVEEQPGEEGLEEQEPGEEGVEEQEPEEEMAEAPGPIKPEAVGDAPAAPHRVPVQKAEVVWPNLEQTVVDRTVLESGLARETRRMEIFIAPLALAVAAVVLFLLGLLLMWRQPAPGEAELPVTDKIDLAPSSLVRVWGLAIVIAVGVLYWLFF